MARIAALSIVYKGKDISKNIASSLISFTFVDNEQGKANEIELLLENKNGLWSSSHYPEKGSVVEIGLKLYDWYKLGEVISVNWGRFTIDELASSSAGIFSMKAISEKCAGAFFNEKRCRTFENVTFREICERILNENNMSLIYKAKKNIKYTKLYQLSSSDASFLLLQAYKSGTKGKVVDDKVIIYDISIKDTGIKLSPKNVKSYEFKSKTFGTYKACEVKYFNAATGEVVTYRAEDGKIKNDSVLIIDEHAENTEHAKNLAESELKRANEKEITASITLMGNPEIFTGCELEINNVGVFAGTYIVEKVTHSISNSQGYTTSFECYMKR